MTDYVPIPCAVYAEHERTILHRRWVRLAWREPDGTDRIATVRPVDLQTRRADGEYLIALTAAGRRIAVRLDRIRSAEPLEEPPSASEL